MDFTVPHITCDVCDESYEATLCSCPSCAERTVREASAYNEMDYRPTIVPDVLPSNLYCLSDYSGVHASGSDIFDEEPGSVVRSISSAPTIAPPTDPQAPEVEYSITDADPEEAALIAAETQRLIEEESALHRPFFSRSVFAL